MKNVTQSIKKVKIGFKVYISYFVFTDRLAGGPEPAEEIAMIVN